MDRLSLKLGVLNACALAMLGIAAACGGDVQPTTVATLTPSPALTPSLDPNDADAYYDRGVDYYNLGELRRAIEDYDTAINLDPNYADAYYGRGVAYYDLGELRRAIEDYDTAINLDPNYADAYYGRGLAYGQLGRVDEAIADLARASELGVDASLIERVLASFGR